MGDKLRLQSGRVVRITAMFVTDFYSGMYEGYLDEPTAARGLKNRLKVFEKFDALFAHPHGIEPKGFRRPREHPFPGRKAPDEYVVPRWSCVARLESVEEDPPRYLVVAWMQSHIPFPFGDPLWEILKLDWDALARPILRVV